MGIFDYLFPKRCIACRKFGDYICTNCFSKISFDVERICLVCNHAAIDGKTHPACKGKYTIDGSMASLVYKGVTKRLVYAFKYQPYISDLHKQLTELFYEGLIQQESFHKVSDRESILVPIPLHPDKERIRSYNQAELLAKGLGKQLAIPVIQVIKRIRKTNPQNTLNREKRKENIKNAFILDERYRKTIQGKQLLLVDDVITSGATLVEAANILKRNGSGKVWGIALAHGK